MPKRWTLRSVTAFALAGSALITAAPVSAGAPASDMTMVVSDRTPVPGEELNVGVENCSPTSLYRLFWKGRKVRVGRANQFGNFARGYTIPYDTPSGPANVKVVCLNDTDATPAESRVIQVQVYRQLARPGTTVSPGDRFTVSGGGCIPGDFVRVYFNGTRMRTLPANEDGRFQATFRIPAGAPSGKQRVYSTCDQVYPPGSTRVLEVFVQVA